MKSPVVKRSIVIAGHKTSVSLEDAFWKGLKEIAGARNLNLSELVAAINNGRDHGNLSSEIRLFVLDHYRAQIGIEESRRSLPIEGAEQRSGGSQQGGGRPSTRSKVQTCISA
jgi:predicted DNA-binding ribbon-helix-helix protein